MPFRNIVMEQLKPSPSDGKYLGHSNQNNTEEKAHIDFKEDGTFSSDRHLVDIKHDTLMSDQTHPHQNSMAIQKLTTDSRKKNAMAIQEPTTPVQRILHSI